MPLIPETWLDSQIVNATQAATQLQPDIAQLANGNLLVTWTSAHSTGEGSPDGTEVFGHLYDPLGTPIGTEFRINQVSTADNERDSDIVALPGGGFIVLYHDDDLDGLGGSIIRLEEFNSVGTPVSESAGVVFDIASGGFPNFADPRGAASSATSVMIVYDRIEAAATSVFFRIYDPTTDTYGVETGLMIGQRTQNADIAVLSNGNYVIAAERIDQTVPLDNSITYRIVTPAGANVMSNTFVTGTDTDGLSDSDVSVTALTGGGFVLVWTQAGVDIDIQARVYDAAGVQTGATSIDAAGITNENNEPVVVGLTDGTFVVIYDNDETGVQTASHRSATGTALGSFDLEGASFAISAVALADGRFAVTYISESDNEVYMEILDTRDSVNDPSVYTPDDWQVGTIGADSFTTADSVAIAHGWAGSDRITEGGGATSIFGDDGDDIIFVTSGIAADAFFGGDDRDTINWSASSQTDGVYNLALGTAFDGVDTEQMQEFEILIGTANVDTIIGTTGTNRLEGRAGDDTINGGAGIDTLVGGVGDDLIFVDNAADQAIENVGEGTDDRVAASASYVLLAGSEIEQMQTTSAAGILAINLTGNALAQRIFGNAGANVLHDGGFGAADTLTGGLGDDTLIVNNAGSIIVEGAGQGADDRVAASVSFVLNADDNIERLTTTNSGGVAAINLTGNALAQVTTGNAGINVLADGAGAGADTLTGLGGNDIYIVRNTGSLIVEGAGFGTDDRVAAGVSFVLAADDNIEVMTTTSAAGVAAINLTGNALAQAITGNAGANVLNGLGGLDTLTGGGGADAFVFSTALGAGNVDTITDFNVAADTIRLENAIFTGLAAGALTAAAFRSNLTGQAADGSDRIIYETDTGNLFFDADGTGAGGRIRFAVVDIGLAITQADFLVI